MGLPKTSRRVTAGPASGPVPAPERLLVPGREVEALEADMLASFRAEKDTDLSFPHRSDLAPESDLARIFSLGKGSARSLLPYRASHEGLSVMDMVRDCFGCRAAPKIMGHTLGVLVE